MSAERQQEVIWNWSQREARAREAPRFDFESDECVENCGSLNRKIDAKVSSCLGGPMGLLRGVSGKCTRERAEHEVVREIEEKLLESLDESPGTSELIAALLEDQMLDSITMSVGGVGPVQAGREFLEAQGFQQNTARIRINGRNRVPDILDEAAGVIGESKNVAYQWYSRQLRDYVAWAQAKGTKLDLYVRESTRLSAPLERLTGPNGPIRLHRIPGT